MLIKQILKYYEIKRSEIHYQIVPKMNNENVLVASHSTPHISGREELFLSPGEQKRVLCDKPTIRKTEANRII